MTQAIGISPEDRFLLIGPSGMLGRAWRELLENKQHHFDTLDYPQLNIADPASVHVLIDKNYQYIINCAAYTMVDQAETDFEQAHAINALGVKHLAAKAKSLNACLVHYGTDYVFNGEANAPYETHAPIQPVNAYGKSKAEGEAELLNSGCDHLMIRTSWLYAAWGHNFVRTIHKYAQERDELNVVNDQTGRPSSATLLAANSYRLLENKARGIYHLTDKDQCTWAEFAQKIVDLGEHTCQIEPCTTAAYPTPAKRPAWSVLDISKAEAIIGDWPNWQDALATVMKEIKNTHE